MLGPGEKPSVAGYEQNQEFRPAHCRLLAPSPPPLRLECRLDASPHLTLVEAKTRTVSHMDLRVRSAAMYDLLLFIAGCLVLTVLFGLWALRIWRNAGKRKSERDDHEPPERGWTYGSKQW